MIFAVLANAGGSAASAEDAASWPLHGPLRDAALRANPVASTPEPLAITIRDLPCSSAALRESMNAHGDRIVSEHDSLDALTVVVHGEDIAGLADNEAILSVSRDHKVRPTGLLDGVFGVVGTLFNVVTNVVDVV